MRPYFSFAVFCAAIVCLGLNFGGATAHAQTPAASAPAQTEFLTQPRTWLIENNSRLVTVREKDGPPLFAQVITTDDLVVEVEGKIAARKISLTLKDAGGKRLYDLVFPTMKQGGFAFWFDAKEDAVTKVKKGGTSFTLTPTDKADSEPPKTDMNLHFVIGGDNIIAGGEAHFGKDRVVVERKGLHITGTYFENGSKTGVPMLDLDIENSKGTLSVNGKEAASFAIDKESGTGRIKDEKGQILWTLVKRDGKDYTEVTFGERKILLEGSNWFINSNAGDVFITKNEDAAKASLGNK